MQEAALTLSEMLQRYDRDNVQVEPATKAKVSRSFRPFMALLGPDRKATNVTKADVVKYQGHLKACQYATASINSYFAAVSSVFGWFVQLDELETNPFRGVKKIREEHRIVTTYEAGEFDQLLKAVSDLRWREQTTPLRLTGILWAAWHDLRISEVLNLRWVDIDLDAGVLWVQYRVDEPGQWWRWGTKGHRDRIIPMCDELIIHFHRLKVTCPWMYPLLPSARCRLLQKRVGQLSDSIRQFPYSNLYRQLNRIKDEADIEDGAFHKLRRTAATELDAEGLQPTDLQRLMGHRAFSTTQRYIGVRQERHLAAARKAMNARRNAQGISTND